MLFEPFTCDRGRHKLRNRSQLSKIKVKPKDRLISSRTNWLDDFGAHMGKDDLMCIRCLRFFTARGYVDGSGKQTGDGRNNADVQ